MILQLKTLFHTGHKDKGGYEEDGSYGKEGGYEKEPSYGKGSYDKDGYDDEEGYGEEKNGYGPGKGHPKGSPKKSHKAPSGGYKEKGGEYHNQEYDGHYQVDSQPKGKYSKCCSVETFRDI